MENADKARSKEKLLKTSQMIFNKLRHDFVQWGIPISNRIDPVLGFVEMKSCYAVTYQEKDGFKVNVSSLLFDEYGTAPVDALRSILAHELCHTIDGCFNHGAEWRSYVKRLNEEHGFRINPHPFSKKPTDLF